MSPLCKHQTHSPEKFTVKFRQRSQGVRDPAGSLSGAVRQGGEEHYGEKLNGIKRNTRFKKKKNGSKKRIHEGGVPDSDDCQESQEGFCVPSWPLLDFG